MPYDSSTCRWPSAVPPPWLPMAGTRNGSAPSARKCSTAARRITAMLAIPRLPAVMATLCPGCTRRCSSSRASWAWTSPATSATRGRAKFWRTRKIWGDWTRLPPHFLHRLVQRPQILQWAWRPARYAPC